MVTASHTMSYRTPPLRSVGETTSAPWEPGGGLLFNARHEEENAAEVTLCDVQGWVIKVDMASVWESWGAHLSDTATKVCGSPD